LAEAIGSVKDLKRDDVELFIVDDGSNDERTLKEMNALRAQGTNVIIQENRGLAAARNAGISFSTAEYILPLDADNRLRPGQIEHGIRILDANPQVGIVYGDAEYIGERTGRWTVGPFDRDRLLGWNYIDACAMYRRSVWEANDGYDGTMPVQGYEDWDFWLGALEHGWQFAYVPEVLFDYRVGEVSMITKTYGSESKVEEFVARKHGLLYRQAWLSLVNEQRSVKRSFVHVQELLKSRLKQKFIKRAGRHRES